MSLLLVIFFIRFVFNNKSICMDVENDSSLRIDEQVFKNLFDKFYQALCVFASTYLKDDALSADIVQEGFVKFWNKREGFDNYFKVKSFLYTMVRNDCLNYIRDHKFRREDLSVVESLEFYTERGCGPCHGPPRVRHEEPHPRRRRGPYAPTPGSAPA